ncbi:MAG: tRNA pseudouridine(55) synthase TruB [Treponema sp.]|nr:tRNA pseudouridine(55) synthase TruB [Treponema sp.]
MICQEGIALVAKPAGQTSFQSLGPLKRLLGTRRLGHTGTLDKFASGLLVVLVGGLTRLGPWFTALDKVYEAILRFGEETDSLDPEGEVVALAPPPSAEAIVLALPSFLGEIMQSPPAYSAVHIDGKRASDRARSGEVLHMRPRPVTIHELDLVSYDGMDARLRVRCSSGTYIRSLARDLALSVGSRARLQALSRLRVGPFSLSDAQPAEDFAEGRGLVPFDSKLAAALGFEPCLLAERNLPVFRRGGSLRLADLVPLHEGKAGLGEGGGRALAVFSEAGEFLGAMEESQELLRYRFVLVPNAQGELA